jgi:hypothetical protein
MPLWYDLEEPDKYLYHYTTRQAALGAILPKAELRIGLFRYMNDPRESKTWFFALEGDTTASLRELNDEANRIAKATSKLIALTRDAEPAKEPRRSRA